MRLLPDVAATRRVGAALASVVRGGDAIALVGDLGAGKTTLVDACVVALGGEGSTSPTFSLVAEVRCPTLTVWHLDLYRIERAAELRELGLEELLGNPAGITFVEWADKHDVMPRSHLRLTLTHREEARELEAVGEGPRGRELLAALERALDAAP